MFFWQTRNCHVTRFRDIVPWVPAILFPKKDFPHKPVFPQLQGAFGSSGPCSCWPPIPAFWMSGSNLGLSTLIVRRTHMICYIRRQHDLPFMLKWTTMNTTKSPLTSSRSSLMNIMRSISTESLRSRIAVWALPESSYSTTAQPLERPPASWKRSTNLTSPAYSVATMP